MIVQEPVKAAIWHCLNYYDYKDAIFLAERLCSEVETDETVFILATSYYRSNQIQQAYWLLKEKSCCSSQCRYLQAKCAYQLKRYAEAECALTCNNFGDLKNFDDIIKEFGEIACFALQLISEICNKTERTKIAAEALKRALKLNPFLWHAFTDLCQINDDDDDDDDDEDDNNIDSDNIFQINNVEIFKTCQSNTNFINSSIIFNDSDLALQNNDEIMLANLASFINNNNINLNNQQQPQHQQQQNKSTINKNKSKANNSDIIYSTPMDQQIQQFNTPNNNNNNNKNLNSTINILRGGGGGGAGDGANDSTEDTGIAYMTATTKTSNNNTNSSNNETTHDAAKLQAAHILAHMDELMGSGESVDEYPAAGSSTVNLSPFRRNFKYLQSVCPLTPSFGVLPLSPSTTTETPAGYASTNIINTNITTPIGVTPATTTTTIISNEAPSEAKLMRKKIRTHNNNNNNSVGVTTPATSNIATTTTTAATTTPNQHNRSHNALSPTNARSNVFTQTTSNNNNNNNNNSSTGILSGGVGTAVGIGSSVVGVSITTANATGIVVGNNNNNNSVNAAAVRRSSRLFGSNNNSIGVNSSVKENTKTQNMPHNNKFTQPCSPPNRKTKSPRIPKICLNNELIDEKYLNEKKREKLIKIDRTSTARTTTTTTSTANVATTNTNNITATPITTRTEEQTTSTFLLNNNNNNNINNAQKTLINHVLTLKKNSVMGLMSLLREFANGYKMLIKYDCQNAIKHFENNLPNHHLNSCWLQSLIGVAYYELRQYETAIKIFKAIREIEPYRMEYMEIYSSSLWHLQREIELSALSHDFIQHNKLSPVTWCVAGNCFSLHKEHETAIKFFKRAVQVDPEFVYSYTLLGHELVLAEELDKAMDYFRAAVVRDPKHYNAWFGMGTIYSKQEKYELAELHYLKALKINPHNSVILVHIGAMQYCMGKKDKALHTLNTAALLEPRNPLARFHRGSIYFALGRHQEALNELEELKKIVPKESVVFYLIGKIHKQLGNIDLALMHFSWATDLDPKGANNQIKDAFDSMSHQNCCQNVINDDDGSGNGANNLDGDMADATSDHSDDDDADVSAQANQEVNYDSDVY